MGLNIQSESIHINKEKITNLWQLIAEAHNYVEHTVTVQEVTQEQAQELNRKYRKKNKATNVLTFSYEEDEHDISLCLSLAQEEAKQRNISMEEYVAILLAHAFLHVVGMDHTDDVGEKKMRQAELEFLGKADFKQINL
jgi:probable rRNA maturation factor